MPYDHETPSESPFAPSKLLAVPEFDRTLEWALFEQFGAQMKALKKSGHTREVLATFARLLQRELMSKDVDQFYHHSIMHASAIEDLMRAVVGAIEHPTTAGYGYVEQKATHAAACIKNWGPPKEVRFLQDGPIPQWTSVDTGNGEKEGFDYLFNKIASETPNRFDYGEVRQMAQAFCIAAPQWRPMMLVMVTPLDLELPDRVPYDVVCRKVHDEYGLAVCPPDTPLQIMAQRKELHAPPEGEAIICTQPTPEGRLFSLKWGEGAPGVTLTWRLAGSCSARERLIFRRRWKSEDK